MPRISLEKRKKISESILHYLFIISPQSTYTSAIAEEIARDEEFTKQLLLDLKAQKLIVEVSKNEKGKDLKRRQRWALTSQTYAVYKQHQHT